MSFVIRQIAKRADGGDIIRTRTLKSAEITVGRGTDCDIQLADLGIMLRHARLSQLSDGTVAIEAIGGVPMEIGGKFVSRADLAVADKPEINIASHRLTLSPGDTPGAIAITAERVIAATDAADAASETGIFSLRETMPSKRSLAWVMAGIILVAFLALPLFMFAGENAKLPEDMVAAAARPDGDGKAGKLLPAGAEAPAGKGGFKPDMVWTSGPLSTAHAGLSNNCGACHSEPFVSVTDSACTACHTSDAVPDHAAPARMKTGRPPAAQPIGAIHQGLNLPEGRCASCHKEHEGPKGALMVAESFCTDCHVGLSGRLTDTKLVNVPNWEGHPQFKPTLVMKPSTTNPRFQRISLNNNPKENSGLIYPHDVHMSKTNSVANMVRAQGLPGKDGALACNYCHVPDSDGVRFKPIEMEQNCAACHDLSFARDGGIVRTLPHGKPGQVAGIIRDFYLGQAISPRAGVQRLDFERRQPGRMAELEAAELRVASAGDARARADAAIADIFGAKGVCSDCHAIINTGAPNVAERYAVVPVTLTDHYLPKGLFPHKQHKSYDKKTGDTACIACHKGVPTSKTATDVLLPPVAQCSDCHGSTKVATNVAATCDTCHGFHFGDGTATSPHTQPKAAKVAAWQGPVKAGKPANKLAAVKEPPAAGA
jgi:predicted CXXCH cytochrome family protein